MTKIDWNHNDGIVTMVPLTREELECVRVCLKNAPIPYDIALKKIPKQILDKIGEPHEKEHAGEILVECDLERYQ
jgi:hypothetical protein